jgi:hypothetical protein
MEPDGAFDRWPTGSGFEYFHGFIGGETRQFYPTLTEGTTPVARLYRLDRAAQRLFRHQHQEQVPSSDCEGSRPLGWLRGRHRRAGWVRRRLVALPRSVGSVIRPTWIRKVIGRVVVIGVDLTPPARAAGLDPLHFNCSPNLHVGSQVLRGEDVLALESPLEICRQLNGTDRGTLLNGDVMSKEERHVGRDHRLAPGFPFRDDIVPERARIVQLIESQIPKFH